jgi:hypothetical protein
MCYARKLTKDKKFSVERHDKGNYNYIFVISSWWRLMRADGYETHTFFFIFA